MPEDEPQAAHQPHDKLFKSGFSDPATAAAFLSCQLPAALSARIDWSELQLQPGSFVDSQFRHSESDLLYSAPVAGTNALSGTGALIYVLFEHQRMFDAWIGLRLLRYMVRIWEGYLRDRPQAKGLPVIVPVVLAQSAGTWGLNPQFASLLDLPTGLEKDFAGFIPDFAFRLIQLAELPYEKITGTPAGILVLRALKAEQMGQLLGGEVWDEALMAVAPREIFEMVLRYILLAGDIDREAFDRKVYGLATERIKTTAMTLAQQFRQEGRLEGREEGQVLAQQGAVIEALKIRFGQVPEMSRGAILVITDAARLHLLHSEAIRCTSLEAFARTLAGG